LEIIFFSTPELNSVKMAESHVHNESAVALEDQHVHLVYDKIASHFDKTRYKKWPVVEEYLKDKMDQLGADVGCGNGKYLNFNIIGTDYCQKLVQIAGQKGYEGTVGDGLATGFKSDSFDFCISIAVIHHFSTPERRLAAIKELLRIVRPGGSCLVYVWAMEQEKNSRRRFETQDEMVSWKTVEDGEPKTYERYYHLFVKGELDALCEQTQLCQVLESGYDRDNHYVIIKKNV
jgi:tRNA (uracil-5-)-methyltransferase TRM9